jgi:membrane protease YdiL (CAAX protease family)
MVGQIMKGPFTITEAAIAVGYFPLAFMVYFFAAQRQMFKKTAIRLGDTESEPEAQIYLERLLGFLLFGVIPGFFFQIVSRNRLGNYGLSLPAGDDLWLWWVIPLALFIGMYFVRPAKSVDTSFYPQVRKDDWGTRRLVFNTLSWFVYLVGYEFAFRGWLLFTCLHEFGFLPAIMINSAIYSLSHVPKGFGEAIGAFFMGILFCVIAILTGSFIIPLVLHLILAVGNDLKAITINPDMHYSLNRRANS